jgi:Holliday junction resolvase
MRRTKMSDGELRALYRRHLPFVDWQAIESPTTGGGIPDTNFAHGGVEGWVENKTTSSWKVKFRTEQIGWLERRARAGGRVTIAVRQRGRERDDLWLLLPWAARRLLDRERLDLLPSHLVLLHMTGGPSSWDWMRVLRGMKGEEVRPLPPPSFRRSPAEGEGDGGPPK